MWGVLQVTENWNNTYAIDFNFYNQNKKSHFRKVNYISGVCVAKMIKHISKALESREQKEEDTHTANHLLPAEIRPLFQSKWCFFTKNNQNHFRKLSISPLMICRNTSNTSSQSYQHTNAKSSHIDSVRRITTIGEPFPFSSKRGFFLRFSSCSAKRETLAGLKLYGIVWIYLV